MDDEALDKLFTDMIVTREEYTRKQKEKTEAEFKLAQKASRRAHYETLRKEFEGKSV